MLALVYTKVWNPSLFNLSQKVPVAPINSEEQIDQTVPEPEINLLDEILLENRQSESLQTYRDAARSRSTEWVVDARGLLLRKGKLMVADVNNLRTRLLTMIHHSNQTRHPGRNKLRALTSDR